MIDREEVIKVARLARLHLSHDELTHVQQKLNLVLDYFQSLSALPTESVEPTYQGTSELSLREDVSEAPLDVAALAQNAPEFVENSFKLPRVVGSAE